MNTRTVRTTALVVVALSAFAGNSLLCRAALEQGSIDAATFSVVRVGSGAVVLALLARLRGGVGAGFGRGSWAAALALVVYVVGFSYAYRQLTAGTGALVLFGCVQMTMMARAIQRGERPGAMEWLGIVAALAGLVVLVAPGLEAPSLNGAMLMAAAGVAWGIYTLRGRSGTDPLADTAGNFVRGVALVLPVAIVAWSVDGPAAQTRGVVLAVISGAVTSGLGYVVWYAAVVHLTRVRAALVQLAVPALTALAGIAWLGEVVGTRLLVAMALILGGVGVAGVASTPRRRSDSAVA